MQYFTENSIDFSPVFTVAARAEGLAKKVWAIASSPKAQEIYRTVLVNALLVVIFVLLVTIELAKAIHKASSPVAVRSFKRAIAKAAPWYWAIVARLNGLDAWGWAIGKVQQLRLGGGTGF